MPTQTANYDLEKPLVNNATDQDLWGGYLNDDMDSIDTLLRVGITMSYQASQTSSFSPDASISVKKLYPCNATGGGFTATIPAAATAGNGATVFIKKTDSSANVVTLAPTGADTLDNEASLSLTVQNSLYGLVSDGVSNWAAISVNVPVTLSPKGHQEFFASGTFTTPADTISTTLFKFICTAGGGAGGGQQGGSGGGAGGTDILYISGLSASTAYAVVVGAGGVGANNSPGGNGGNSTVGGPGIALVANGGNGGPNTFNNAGGIGAAAGSGASIAIGGGYGASGYAQGNAAAGGLGGASHWGGGGAGASANATGNGHVGIAYGSGGGGGYVAGTSAGGNGAIGIVTVEWQ